PFGFGLSYTSFSFDSLTLSSPSVAKGGSVKVSVKISNTGKRDAVDVVQLYLSKEKRNADDPLFSLRAFRRAAVPAGKTVEAEFDLPASAFETVNAEGDGVLAPGSYIVTAADAAPVEAALERGAPKPVSAVIRVQA
ncbi:MAG: fibronectin type III-like domain-contianing protein, partial [Treponema sp.]|nr:fibronectin type III-like domain-contianing protein [Treponema sp.]